MIETEMKSDIAVVRIHDEYYVREPQRCLTQLDRIISDVYKRKALSHLTPAERAVKAIQ